MGTNGARLRHFRIVAPYLRRRWALVAVQILCYVAAAFVTAAAGTMIQQITDAAVKADWDAALGMALPVAGLLLGGAVAAFGGSASSGNFCNALSREMRADAVRRMLAYPYAYFEAHHTGDLVSRLNNDIGRVQYFFQDTFAGLIREPLLFCVIAVYLALIDWKLLVPTLLLTMITVYVNFRLGKPLLRNYGEQQEGYAVLTRAVQDTVQGIGIVKAYGLQGRMMARIREGNRKITENVLGVISIAARRTYIMGINQHVPMLLTVLWGGTRTIQGTMSPGDLFAFLFLYRFLNKTIAAIPDLTAEVQGIRGILARVNGIWEFPVERTNGGRFGPEPGKPVLDLADVRFSYSPESPVLEGIDLAVREGETVAVVGPSGCGKSTLLKLLCAFHEPTGGTIRIHGHPLAEWSLADLRSLISLVSQETFLFPVSIADNIAYGSRGADAARIARAAVMAGADAFIRELPEGYGTLAGERGVRLSGGQRQRIAIARALLKDAPILLLDEPTSSLDAGSEAVVRDTLEKLMKGRTVLISAHRLSTIRGADTIVVLEDGRIAERGTHRSLLEAGGAYSRLYRRQTEDWEA